MSNYFRAINEDFGNDTESKETKEYYADVRIDWGTSFEAKNKEDFVIKLKEQFKQDYNIELTDDEIHNVQNG